MFTVFILLYFIFLFLYCCIHVFVLFEPGGKDISRRPFTALRTDLCSRDLMFGSLGLDWAPSVLQIDFDVKENSVEIY